ncbi:hypothetical protein GJ496_002201 [Pomphorhynchus laevis]|nr:hypothetical protein GJ496_002201 [Pomphorhynchus laevis]
MRIFSFIVSLLWSALLVTACINKVACRKNGLYSFIQAWTIVLFSMSGFFFVCAILAGIGCCLNCKTPKEIQINNK